MGSFNVVADISVFDQRRKLCLHSISTASQVMDCPFQNSQWIKTIELIWNSLISSCYRIFSSLISFSPVAQLRSLRKLQDQSIVFNIRLQFRWMFYNSLQGRVVKVVWSSDFDPAGIARDSRGNFSLWYTAGIQRPCKQWWDSVFTAGKIISKYLSAAKIFCFHLTGISPISECGGFSN